MKNNAINNFQDSSLNSFDLLRFKPPLATETSWEGVKVYLDNAQLVYNKKLTRSRALPCKWKDLLLVQA